MRPICFCETCQENMPVIVEEYHEQEKNKIIPVIFCPQCENILNTVDDIKLVYINDSELPKYTNWKVKVADEISE